MKTARILPATIAAVFLLTGCFAVAQGSGSLRSEANALFDSPGQVVMREQLMSVDTFVSALGADSITAAQKRELKALLDRESPALFEAMRKPTIDAWVKTFTLEELRAFTDWSSSPIGVSILRKQGQLATQTNDILEEAISEEAGNFLEALLEIMS